METHFARQFVFISKFHKNLLRRSIRTMATKAYKFLDEKVILYNKSLYKGSL